MEDDVEIMEILTSYINSYDDLLLTATFLDAEAYIKKFSHTFADVVIMDIGLPGKTGIQAVQQLKPLNQHIQYLMCTVFDDDERIFDALCMGATGYLHKAITKEELHAAIVNVHAGGSPMSPSIARKIVFTLQQRKSSSIPYEDLKPRHWEILHLLDKGLRYKEISDKLCLGIETVRSYIRDIYNILQVHSRTDALNKVFPNK